MTSLGDRPPRVAAARLPARGDITFDLDPQTLARYGLVVLAALIPLQRATVIGAVGSLVSLVAIIVIPLALWAEWTRGSRWPLTAMPLVTIVAFTWWAGATYFWSVNPDVTAGNFFRLVPIVTMAVAFLSLAWQPTLRLHLLRAYVAGSVVASSLVIWQFLTTPAAQRVSVSPDASINQVAFTLVLALVPAAYLLARALRRPPGADHSRGLQLVLYGCAYSLIAIAVLLSGSRSAAVLGVLATLAAVPILLTAGRSVLDVVKGLAAMLLLAVALTAAFSLAEAPPLERLTAQEGSDLREEARVGLLMRAWAMSADRPLIGAGLGTGVNQPVPGYTHETRNPHNTHAQIFLELGAIGAVLWASLLLTIFRAAWAHPPLERLMWTTQLALLVIGIGARGFIFGVPMWFFLGITAALAGSSALEPGRRRREP